MKTREFDPVRSAALRNRLETLPTAAPPARSRTLRRPQVWVTAVTAAVLLVATVGVLHAVQPRAVPPAHQGAVSDPMTWLTDPDDPRYVAQGVLPLLRVSGIGSGTWAVDVPDTVTSVRTLVSCSREVRFAVVLDLWTSTTCDPRGPAGWGDVPVEAGPHQVALHVPAGVSWRMVVIATPDAGTTVSTLRVTAPGVPPQILPARYPAPDQERDAPVGVASGGSGTSRGRLTAPVDTLAVVTSCRGSGGLIVTFSDGAVFGTEAAPIPCGTPAVRAAEAIGDDTANGFTEEGRLRWTVRATGDVVWTATFSSRSPAKG